MQQTGHCPAGCAIGLFEDVVEEKDERAALRPLGIVREQNRVLAQDDDETGMVLRGEQFVREQILPDRFLVLRTVPEVFQGNDRERIAIRRRQAFACELGICRIILENGGLLQRDARREGSA